MSAYYNEIDPHAAQWLRNLISAGHIAPGDVDERSIEDVRPDELAGYTQCHFFAGIGVWSHALRRAGWPDDRPIWTGSCPCQPFSAAGAGAGFADERHLWPAFFHLIRERRPAVVAGEQVASKDADPWIDLVCADLGSLGYASGAVAFPSASVGAPHIRDRLYWVAHAEKRGRREERPHIGRLSVGDRAQRLAAGSLHGGGAHGLGHAERIGPQERGVTGGGQGVGQAWSQPAGAGANGRLADAQCNCGRCQAPATDHRQPEAERPADRIGGCGGALGRLADAGCERRQQDAGGAPGDEEAHGGAGRNGREPDGDHVAAGDGENRRPGPANGFWAGADWLLCRDGRWRPVEPGTFPLAHGVAGRVGRLRAYGNAINAEAARAFIECVMESAQ